MEEFLIINPINNEIQIKLELFIKQWEFIIEDKISSKNSSLLAFNKINGGIIKEIKSSINDLKLFIKSLWSQRIKYLIIIYNN